MRDRKNIFAIARRGSSDDEDQLTELLAFLLQKEPAVVGALLSDFGCAARSASIRTQQKVVDGRLDLEFDAPGAAGVVVESKLRSSTTFAQCKKYIEHLAHKGERFRALVLLTKLIEPWPEGVQNLAADCDVQLVARRWWDVTSLLRATEIPLAIDFAEMLEGEGLVIPGPITDNDWSGACEIPPAVFALLNELRPGITKLSGGFRRYARFSGRDSSYQSVYSLAYFENAQIGTGLAASWRDLASHRQLNGAAPSIGGPVIAVSVMNPSLPEADRPAAAEDTVSLGGDGVVGSCWGKFPTRAASAASVLTATDFLGQVDQAFEYARATVEYFRKVGYLKDIQ